MVEVAARRVGEELRARRVVDPGAQDGFHISVCFEELSSRFAFQSDHPGDCREARGQVGHSRRQQRLEIQRLNHLGRGKVVDVDLRDGHSLNLCSILIPSAATNTSTRLAPSAVKSPKAARGRYSPAMKI